MAHELSIQNGVAEFIANKPAWHRLGTVKPDMTYTDAIEVVGYEVVKRPLITTVPVLYEGLDTGDSFDVPVPEHFAMVRTDTNGVLGVVGSRYTPVQNADVFRIADALESAGLVRMEAAGALRNGADAWMSFSFKGDAFAEAAETSPTPTNYFGLLTANHTGASGVRLATVPLVVVCANTLAMALGRQSLIHTVRHTTNAKAYVEREALRLWAEASTDAQLVSDALRAMAARELTAAEIEAAVLNVIAPIPTLEGDKSDRAKARHATAVQKAEELRATVLTLGQGKALGLLGNGSAYDWLMTATEALDHHDVVPLTRGAAAKEAGVAFLPGGTIEEKKVAITANLWRLTNAA